MHTKLWEDTFGATSIPAGLEHRIVVGGGGGSGAVGALVLIINGIFVYGPKAIKMKEANAQMIHI